jgi:hypothetical protein
MKAAVMARDQAPVRKPVNVKPVNLQSLPCLVAATAYKARFRSIPAGS